MATRPINRDAANTGDDRRGLTARSSVVAPTIRFDWTVKKAKVLKARSTGVRKWPALLCAAVNTLTMTPTVTHAAVAPNQMRDHLSRAWRAESTFRAGADVTRARSRSSDARTRRQSTACDRVAQHREVTVVLVSVPTGELTDS